MNRVWPGIAMALALSGCAGAPPPSPLSLGALQSFQLVGVEVHSQGAVASWPAKEAELAARADLDPATRANLPVKDARAFPQAQIYFEQALQQRFNTDMAKAVAPLMNGRAPVVAVVQVRQFDVPSVVRRVFVDQEAKLELQIDLVDKKTRLPLLTYRTPQTQRWMIGGLGAIADGIVDRNDTGMQMIDEATNGYRDWLAHPGAGGETPAASSPEAEAQPEAAGAYGVMRREPL